MSPATARLVRLHQLRTQLADAARRERLHVSDRLAETERSAAAMSRYGSLLCAPSSVGEHNWRDGRAEANVAHLNLVVLLRRTEDLRTAQEQLRAEEQATAMSRDQAGHLLACRREAEALQQERRTQKELDDLYSASRLRARRATSL